MRAWLTRFLDWFSEKPPVQPAPIPTPAVSPDWRQQLLAAHNAARVQAGLPTLRLNAALSAAAQAHAETMYRVGILSHQGIGDGDPGWRMTNAGYRWRAYEENVAEGQQSVDAVMVSWLNSPLHRADILSPNVTEIGFGLSGLYWCVDFAAPAS